MSQPKDNQIADAAKKASSSNNSSNISALDQQGGAGEKQKANERAVEAAKVTEALLKESIGLNKPPLRGMVEFTVKRAEMEAQRGEGVSRAQNVCFVNEHGQKILGAQYTKSDGTYLKTRTGETYTVSAETGGRFSLIPKDGATQPFNAVRMMVVPDMIGAKHEGRIFVSQSKSGERTVAATPKPQEGFAKLDSAPAQPAAAADQVMIKQKEAELSVALSAVSQTLKASEQVFATNKQAVDQTVAANKMAAEQVAADNKAVAPEQPVIQAQIAQNLEPQDKGSLSGQMNLPTDIAGGAKPDITAVPTIKSAWPPVEAPAPFSGKSDVHDFVEPNTLPDHPVEETEIDSIVPPLSQIQPVDEVSTEAKEEVGDKEETEEQPMVLDEARKIKPTKDERRRRYIVKEKDTLQSIATKQLRDVRLAELIYEINKHLIPIKMVRGRPVRQLKPRLAIYLPTTEEVEEFRAQFGGISASVAEDVEASQIDVQVADALSELTTLAAEERAADKPAEPAGPSRQHYTVRLGDTLKSVAMKHPSLQNIAMWELLAKVNDLSSELDSRGQPTVRLVRGMKLMLPTPEEIEEFKTSQV